MTINENKIKVAALQKVMGAGSIKELVRMLEKSIVKLRPKNEKAAA